MLERIVESWLTNAGERGAFERAFTQLLAIEGEAILHGPVHHPFEHGKDIIALDKDGSLLAFQLKAGDIGLAELEAITGQLFALAHTAANYPGIEPPRRPDRVYLVTSGRLTPPARDRLAAFNDGNRGYGAAAIAVTEQEHLVSRFVAAHGRYLPTNIEHLDALLRILVGDGSGPFPVQRFAAFLEALTKAAKSDREIVRAIASSVLLTSYAVGPWERVNNHLAVAEAWLATLFAMARAACLTDIDDEDWSLSFNICRDAVRAALGDLLLEAATLDDLVIPDLAEGLVYGTRATLVLGYCCAFYLAEREIADASRFEEPLRETILRELNYLRAVGEAAAPYLLLIATTLQVLGELPQAGRLLYLWASELAAANGKKRGEEQAQSPLADPYHSLEECLLRNLGADTDNALEQFNGHAYTLHVTAEWFARRAMRVIIEQIWKPMSHAVICEFRPQVTADIFAHHTDDGQLEQWVLPITGSWRAIERDAVNLGENDLPGFAWRNLDCLVYLPLIYPYRLTSAAAKAIDYLVTPDLVNVALDANALSTPSNWGYGGDNTPVETQEGMP